MCSYGNSRFVQISSVQPASSRRRFQSVQISTELHERPGQAADGSGEQHLASAEATSGHTAKKTKNRTTLKSCVCSGSTAMPLKALQPDVSWWFSACCCLAEITASGLQAHEFTRALRLLRNWREKHPSPSEREDASTLLLPTAPPAHTHIRCLPPTSLRLCT